MLPDKRIRRILIKFSSTGADYLAQHGSVDTHTGKIGTHNTPLAMPVVFFP